MAQDPRLLDFLKEHRPSQLSELLLLPELKSTYPVRESDLAGPAVQEAYGPKSICFGCGPSNQKGLKIRTFLKTLDTYPHFVALAKWRALPEHQAFPGMLNGGIIGALLDCHSNWTASVVLKALFSEKYDPKEAPCSVTASFNVSMLKPTPVGGEITLRAIPYQIEKERFVKIAATLEAGGEITATCDGLFVAVKEGHPAYHRW